jgi:hypothetical protein
VKFNVDELTGRVQKFINEIKILMPKIGYLSCDLEYEFIFDRGQIWLVIFLTKQPQFVLPVFDISLGDAKLEVIEELKNLPLDLNLLALETYSIESEDVSANYDHHDEKIKQLMKRKRKETLKFLLEDEDINLGFPELAPYIIDRAIRLIEFKIEYIHCDYFKIKLLSDSLSDNGRKRTAFLKVGSKISDDSFFFCSAEALRSKPKKLLALEAYCFRDSITNDILMYQIV